MQKMIRRGLPAVFVALLTGALPMESRAAQQTTTWLGGNGYWSDATKWSGGVVPNNTADTTYAVNIDGGNSVNSAVGTGNLISHVDAAVNELTIDSGDSLGLYLMTLQINEKLTLNGTLSMFGGHVLLPPDSIIEPTENFSLYTSSSLASASGSLTIASGASIPGSSGSEYLLEWPTIGSRTTKLINHADLTYPYGGVIFAGSAIDNRGSITVSNGATVGFNTGSTLDQLGKLINNGGQFAIFGTLENTGKTFRVDHNSGQWALGGTIHGGTIETGDGMSLSVPFGAVGVLDDVDLNGRILLTTILQTPAGKSFTGTGDIDIDGSADAPEGRGLICAQSGTTIIGPGLTIGGGVTPNFQPSDIGAVGNRNGGYTPPDLIIHGTIRPSSTWPDRTSVMIQLVGSTITNDGVLDVADKTFIHAWGDIDFVNGGKLVIDGGGELDVFGDLDLSTDADFLDVYPQANGQPYDAFRIVGCGTLTGIFDHVTPGIKVDYSTPGEILISGTPVPEPTGAVLLMGLIGISGCLGRRRGFQPQGRPEQLRNTRGAELALAEARQRARRHRG
jgi:hypothetical protein